MDHFHHNRYLKVEGKKENYYFWISMRAFKTMITDWDSNFYTKPNIVDETSAIMESYGRQFSKLFFFYKLLLSFFSSENFNTLKL